MTFTTDHDCSAQSQHFNGPDVKYKEPDKPAKTQFKITVKPTAARSSRPEVQRALRQYYDNPVLRLQRQLENHPIFQIQKIMDSALPRIPESLLELERMQRSMRAFDSYRL